MTAIAFVVLLVLVAYALYSYVFFAWLTATPLTAEQLKRAQYDGEVWLIVAGVGFVGIIALAIWRIRLRRKHRNES